MTKTFILLIFPFLVLSQNLTDSGAMQKLKNSKELLDMGLITQSEFDSIAKDLKDLILNAKIIPVDNKSDGFYIGEKRLYPEKFAESKTDVIGSALTYGLAGGGIKSVLNGRTSKNKLLITNQIFTLKINRNVDAAGNRISSIVNQQFFSDAQSPNDFALIKLNTNISKSQRSIKTGSMSVIGGYRFQIKKKLYIDFDWKEISPNKYEIKTNLEEGNYAFVFVGTTAFSNNALYTFTVVKFLFKK